MRAAKVLLKDAEKVRQQLLTMGEIDTHFRAHRDGDFFFIPLKRKVAGMTVAGMKNVEHTFEEKDEKNALEKELSKALSAREMTILPRSQEIIGDIMILEIPYALSKKERTIAQIFLRVNRHVKTVVKKRDAHGGTFRTRTVTVLAGRRKKETVHRESGCNLKVHVENMYFSGRLAHERLRIAQQVKKSEHVLVMFSGCAPYVCVIAKKSGAHVTGIEINRAAHDYALENVQRNKLQAELYCGDVKKALPKIKKRFERIVMPLPKTGEEFLSLALHSVKYSGIIHFYAFLRESEVEAQKKKIKMMCTTAGKKCRILRVVHAGQHAPYVFRMCFDIKVR